MKKGMTSNRKKHQRKKIKTEINKAYWKAEYSEKLYRGVVEDKSLLHQVGVKDREVQIGI